MQPNECLEISITQLPSSIIATITIDGQPVAHSIFQHEPNLCTWLSILNDIVTATRQLHTHILPTQHDHGPEDIQSSRIEYDSVSATTVSETMLEAGSTREYLPEWHVDSEYLALSTSYKCNFAFEYQPPICFGYSGFLLTKVRVCLRVP